MANLQKFDNNAETTIGTALSIGSPTLNVNTGDGGLFKEIIAPDFQILTITDGTNIEIVKVTAHTAGSDNFTITRAQEGTTDQAWAIGDTVELRLTEGLMNNLIQFNTGGDALGTNSVNLQLSRFDSSYVASGNYAVAVGASSESSGNSSISIGAYVYATDNETVAIGAVARADGLRSIAIGTNTTATPTDGIAIGRNAEVDNTSSDSIAIGAQSQCVNTSNESLAISAISNSSYRSVSLLGNSNGSSYAVSIGGEARVQSSSNYGISIGRRAKNAYSAKGIAIGNSSYCYYAARGIAIGEYATVNKADTIAIGTSTSTDTIDQIIIGKSATGGSFANEGIAIGAEAQIATPYATVLNNPIIVNSITDAATVSDRSDRVRLLTGEQCVITTEDIDLTAISNTDIRLPTNFFCEEVGVICTAISGVTTQPTISYGNTNGGAEIQAATITTALTAQGKRERNTSPLLADTAHTTGDVFANITVAATATTLEGRFYFKGFFIKW